MKITVLYSCHACGLKRIEVDVLARENEDVVAWMDAVGHKLSEDHARKSPHCRPQTLSDVMIPIAGAEKVGGPAVQ